MTGKNILTGFIIGLIGLVSSIILYQFHEYSGTIGIAIFSACLFVYAGVHIGIAISNEKKDR